MKQIELEVGKNCNTFDIPDNIKKVTVKQVGNKIVLEMVQEKEPKPGDVMINKHGSVYIFKENYGNIFKENYGNIHKNYAFLRKDGHLIIGGHCFSGRPATPEEAQRLWDALRKAGKRWNPETMQVEDLPEMYYIREWVERYMKAGHYKHEHIALAISMYLEYREGKK